jgi:2-oxoacid:acceptor oxidoreductase gamma subunit (pyruvate/2-ketoisovalerate family)
MEREIALTGIGGQGVQLGAQVLARAAAEEGRHVLLLGTYGGTMRGGPTDSTLVVGDEPISAPPLVSRTWSAVAMHHAFWEPVARKLRPDAVVVVNASLFEGELDRSRHRVFDVPATKLASELGSPLSASLVLVAAFARITGLLSLDSLVDAMRASLPPYRSAHADANERALRASFEAAPAAIAPAWEAT